MRFLAASILTALLVPAFAFADDLRVASEPPSPATPSPVVASAPPPKVATVAPQAPKPTLPRPVPTRTRFYGWQNILVGELGLAAAFGGAFLGEGEPAALGGLVYLFGGPIIHGVHGGGMGKVFASLGGNVGFPLLGALAGFAATSEDEDGGGQGAAIGALVGCAVAPLWDGLVLGWETKRGDGSVGKSKPAAPPMVGVAKTKDGWTATVAGAF